MRHSKDDLKIYQSLSLDAKVQMTKQRIKAWYEAWKRFDIYNENTGKTRSVTVNMNDKSSWYEPPMNDNEYVSEIHDGQVYVSFSGGKDSTVLLHLVREMFPDVEAVFVNTGLEYPEIQKFVKTFDNVTILRPKMRFDEVISKYGYPVISKEVSEAVYGSLRGWKSMENKLDLKLPKYKDLTQCDFLISHNCCSVMKKSPAKVFESATGKKPILATMTEESRLRQTDWLKNGCNAFNNKRAKSNPLSFWTEQDVLQYIKKYDISVASVYGSVEYAELPEQVRFEELGLEGCGTEQLATTGCERTGCIFCGFGCHLESSPSRFERLRETHPRQYAYCLNGGEYDKSGLWKPNKDGLGMKHVFDELNRIYGDGFIKY